MNENQNDYVDINAHDNYPDSEQKIEIPTTKVIPLKKICMTIGQLPTAYLETMSYYEMLIWFIEYLKNNIIPTINNNASAVQEVQNVVMNLQTYINNFKDSIDEDVEGLEEYMNNYFDNLDVQEEINNKLDEMLEDGVLEQIIEQFIQSSAIWCFDTVADMKQATNLINGSYAKTLGYYSINDGGGAIYKITDTASESDYQEELESGLYATLIINNQTINIKQIGVYGDGTHDDTNKIQYALTCSTSLIKKILFNEKYLISDTLVVNSNKDLLGIKSNQEYNEGTEPIFLTNNNITVFDLSTHKNISIENINIIHPDNNTADIFNLYQSKYILLKNIQVKHETNVLSNCIVVNDTTGNDGFSGYITIDNLRCIKYNIGIKSKATFIKIKNCVINNMDSYAIWLTGEGIGGITGCDITGLGIAIRYDGSYSLDLINNYFEGYYIDSFIKNTNNVKVNINGCKIYQGEYSSGRVKQFTCSDTTNPYNFENIKNSYVDGYPSLQNKTVNGNFEHDFLGWTYNPEHSSIINKSEMSSIPTQFNNCVKVGNGVNTGYSTIQETVFDYLNTNDYITIGLWYYLPANQPELPKIEVEGYTSLGTYESIINASVTNIINKWNFITLTGKSLGDYSRIRISISTRNQSILYVTGISLNKGFTSNRDSSYSPNFEKTITNKLVIKGTNGNYYQIKCDGTNLSFEQVTNINN